MNVSGVAESCNPFFGVIVCCLGCICLPIGLGIVLSVGCLAVPVISIIGLFLLDSLNTPPPLSLSLTFSPFRKKNCVSHAVLCYSYLAMGYNLISPRFNRKLGLLQCFLTSFLNNSKHRNDKIVRVCAANQILMGRKKARPAMSDLTVGFEITSPRVGEHRSPLQCLLDEAENEMFKNILLGDIGAYVRSWKISGNPFKCSVFSFFSSSFTAAGGGGVKVARLPN